jgi:hypothetical protein
MAMGTAGAHAWIISLKNLRAICPQEVRAMEEHEDFKGWSEFAEAIRDENVPKTLEPLLTNLVDQFEKATTVEGKGLSLSIGWYDEENGERYDEIEHVGGCYFEVDGVEVLSPAGAKFSKELDQANWTVWG